MRCVEWNLILLTLTGGAGGDLRLFTFGPFGPRTAGQTISGAKRVSVFRLSGMHMTFLLHQESPSEDNL